MNTLVTINKALKHEALLNEMVEQRKVKKMTKELLIKISRFKRQL